MYPEPVVTIEEITPARAAAWLLENSHNRRLNPGRVSRLAATMSRGEWLLNGEAIKFNGAGLLIDGQHRLAAVVESGVTIKSLVVRGLPVAAQETLDLGAKRGIADMFTLRGIPQASRCATVTGLVFRWEAGYPSALRNNLAAEVGGSAQVIASSMTPPQAFEVWERHGQGILESVRMVEAKKTHLRPLGLSAGLVAFLDYLLGSIDREDASAFTEALLLGADLDNDDPRYLLRERLLRDAASRDRAPKKYLLALSVKAWNLWRVGEKRSQLGVKPGEGFPVPDGATGWTDWAATRATRKAAA
jgi:hypothetical protein